MSHAKNQAEKIKEIESAALSGSGRVNVENSFFAVCEKGKVRIVKEDNEAAPKPQLIRNFGKYAFSRDKTVIILKQSDENVNVDGIINKKLTFYSADYDKIQGDVVLRNRLRGDKTKPVGAAHTKELRKILQEKLPEEKRKISQCCMLSVPWQLHDPCTCYRCQLWADI